MTVLPESLLRLKSGEDHKLEEEAAALLAKGREGVTALKAKRDYFTHDQLMLRTSKEVFNVNGVSDEALMSGLFKRAFNENRGHRPTGLQHGHDRG